MSLLRSILFVPGSRPDRFLKARDSGADAYCIDLEDAVTGEDKTLAREAALAHIALADSNCFLRINSLATKVGLEDLLAIAALGAKGLPAGIIVPMLASPFEVRQIVQVSGNSPSLNILPMIETPEGLDNLPAILDEGSDFISAIAFGYADYSAITGSDMSWDALLCARSTMVKVASGRGVQCIDGPCFDIANTAALAEESLKVCSIGFTGKLAIHPSQVESINNAFVPSSERVSWARGVINTFEKAGGGAVLHGGLMIDQPLVSQAKRILASAEK